MKNTNAIVTFILFSLLLPLCACKNNIQTMLDDYNGHFEPGPEPSHVKSPGDPGFTADGMLSMSYYVSSEGSVNLSAPPNCTSYTWTFYKSHIKTNPITAVEETEYEDITDILYFYNNCNKHTKDFRAYIPNSQYEADSYLNIGTYKLELVVTDISHKEYKDSCTIVIYKQIH